VTTRYDLKLLYSRDDIALAVGRLGAQISIDYDRKDLLVVGVLKGAVIFLADLIREISTPLEIDFIGLSSYGNEATSCGEVKVTVYPTTRIEGRHILVVEDIVDTGLCIETLMKYLKARQPASLRLCALLEKPSRRRVPIDIAYLGFAVPNKFVVGYGLDYSQHYRHLPQIYMLEEVADDGQLASDD
jgi:hypoxanthine phosphoribosyltransferase